MSDQVSSFKTLGLSDQVLKALETVGYETPSPIQAESIPPLLEGDDIIGQAQTGTGKTAAFALPLLSKIDLSKKHPQILVLAPTRELAIQVAEAFQTYARNVKGFHVLPIYGGQAYDGQLRQLRRGVHAVVGTPGRVMDHIRRGTLKLEGLTTLVLDEADEMLRMGFIDDVEWILDQTPETRQIALFSATMPSVIKKIARKYLSNPTEIKIAAKTTTAKTIRQRYWQVNGRHKLDALTRILEVEDFDALLIFVRTKTATVELTEKLEARGYPSAALNGDIPQNQRERTVDRLKQGKLDILIATDVAARGLDVARISHVINYDIPYDAETYVHRIGRTGRAGKSGEAILFVASKEKRLLSTIEKTTKQPIEAFKMPTTNAINEQRIAKFKQKIGDHISKGNLEFFSDLVSDYQQEEALDPIQIAAALASMLHGNEPFLMTERQSEPSNKRGRESSSDRSPRDRGSRSSGKNSPQPDQKALPLKGFPEIDMKRFRVEVGYRHEVKPGNLVGAIANEAEIESQYIGHIEIYEDFTTVDLPDEMPNEVLQILRKARVCGHRLEMKPLDAKGASSKHGKRGSGSKRNRNNNPGKRRRKSSDTAD